MICHVPELDVAPGERIAIVGPNGSGKTTLLRVFAGLEQDTRGECHVASPLRHRVYVHQTPYLFQGSVACNAGYGLAARKVARNERISKVAYWLNAFGVDHLAERRCDRLSAGERRRVALARAFAVRAELLLLDEPLAELDEAGVEIVCRAIAAEAAATIVIASPVPLPAALPARSYHLSLPAR
jgi:ABC-type nitrate/sulfonate/bicarbonate transport system ATPase subunit